MHLLATLLVILVSARLGGEIMQRAGQPAILGELLAGVGLSLMLTYLPGQIPILSGLPQDATFRAISDLGIFFLMFLAGLELSPEKLLQASRAGLAVAAGGVVVPLALGLVIGYAFLPASNIRFAQSFFLGITISITAVAVSVKVLMDLHILESRLGNVIVSAAVIDDVIGLLLLAVLAGVVKFGEASTLVGISVLSLKVVGFFAFSFFFGRYASSQLEPFFLRLRSDEMVFSATIVLAVLFGIASEFMGLHFTIGAFIAGLVVHEGTAGRKIFQDLLSRTSGLTLGFFSPFFFSSIGLQMDLSALGTAPVFTLALFIAAVIGKLFGCGFTARKTGFSARESLAIGIAMNGRGAVELIVAAVALKLGLFNQPTPVPPIVAAIYTSVVTRSFVTTLLTPIALEAAVKTLSMDQGSEGENSGPKEPG